MVGDVCASSIQIVRTSGSEEVSFSSRTDFRYERRGLNSLARSVAFIACSTLEGMTAVKSIPLNAVSPHNFVKIFGASASASDQNGVSIWSFFDNKPLKDTPVPKNIKAWRKLMDDIEEEEGEGSALLTKVRFTPTNIQRAEKYMETTWDSKTLSQSYRSP